MTLRRVSLSVHSPVNCQLSLENEGGKLLQDECLFGRGEASREIQSVNRLPHETALCADASSLRPGGSLQSRLAHLCTSLPLARRRHPGSHIGDWRKNIGFTS